MILRPTEEISDKRLDQRRNEGSKGIFGKTVRYLNIFLRVDMHWGKLPLTSLHKRSLSMFLLNRLQGFCKGCQGNLFTSCLAKIHL